MQNDDTIKLLKECHAGTKTAVASIEEIMSEIQEGKLKDLLEKAKQDHEAIGEAVHSRLIILHDQGKEPNPMAKAMSWMKINGKMMMHHTEATAADLMMDGCNMGIKSISRYLNQYAAADDEAKAEVEQLVKLEQDLMNNLRGFL